MAMRNALCILCFILSVLSASGDSTKTMASVTALVVGGTSGIGQAMAFKLASYSTQPHLIISGRNAQAAEATLEKLKTINPSGKYEFLPIDMSRLKKVKQFTQTFCEQQPKLNFLVISSGFLSLKGRAETEEGIDEKLAVNYYGRFVLIKELIPLFEKTAQLGEEARVLTILAAGKASTPPPFDDMDLKTGYGLQAAAEHATLYNDLMVEEFSRRHPTVAFLHAYPGFVATPIINNLPFYARWPAQILSFFATSADDCADYLLSGFTHEKHKQGWYLLNEKGQEVPKTSVHTDEARQKVWAHSNELTERVLSDAACNVPL